MLYPKGYKKIAKECNYTLSGIFLALDLLRGAALMTIWVKWL